ncbi:MAG: hypothetical protein HOJ35_02210 [Bdellovibrionales bacterium]|jgi:hypothetical protein|nr:hypothetical protein [Bdellovibrionales bacterium]
MTTVDLKLATETIKNLNAALTVSSNLPTATSGTYALINRMISDLVSIKNSIKTEEKILITNINTHVGTNGTTLGTADAVACTAEATLSASAGLGNEAARYSGTDKATTALYPAVLGTGETNKYAETTVFTILAEAAQLIIHLKSNATTNSAGKTITAAITLA